MIEAELKAHVRDPAGLHEQLRCLATAERSTYYDTYYDQPGGELTRTGRELRLRTVETDERKRSLLTYKEREVDPASGSKPEHETGIDSPSVVDIVLRGLGLGHLVTFEKHCTNYRFSANGRDMLATVVTVPELDGTFIELETMTAPDDTAAALADIRTVMTRLGISEHDLTTEQYTDAVLRRRHCGPPRSARPPPRRGSGYTAQR
jgi:adenylate cyclase, class 2